jgi:phosphatidylserine/phosphatidylglycerophosphate/cardiolipin synthase-like enzyme
MTYVNSFILLAISTLWISCSHLENTSSSREPANEALSCNDQGKAQEIKSKFLSTSSVGRYDLLLDNEKAWSRILDIIFSAKRKIVAQYFVLGTDRYAKAFLGALLFKQKQGIKVELMIDGLGSLEVSYVHYDLLQELVYHGAEVYLFGPLSANPVNLVRSSSNHEKFIIADDCQVMTGGRNIWERSFVSLEKMPKAFVDVDIHLESKELAREFDRFFRLELSAPATKKVKKDLINFSSKESELFDASLKLMNEHRYSKFEGFSKEAPMWAFKNTSSHVVKNREKSATEMFVYLIEKAQHEIYISNPYIVLTAKLKQALIGACERNVDITLMTMSPLNTDILLSQAAFNKEWPELLALCGTMRIFVSLGPEKVHEKVATIDDEIALVGSFNLDSLSEFHNADNFVLVESTELNMLIKSNIEEYISINTQEYKLVNGQAVGPELLKDQDKVNKVKKYEGWLKYLRSRL